MLSRVLGLLFIRTITCTVEEEEEEEEKKKKSVPRKDKLSGMKVI